MIKVARKVLCLDWDKRSMRIVVARLNGAGDGLIAAATASFEEDTDVEWRPRLPQWPAVGEIMATAIQASLVGQASPADSLNDAQTKIEKPMVVYQGWLRLRVRRLLEALP